MSRSAILFMAFILLAGTGAAAPANDTLIEESTLQIPIDEEETISPLIENPLSVQDNITLKLTGRSLTDGLVSHEIEGTDRLRCNDDETVCNITVDGLSSQEIYITLSGTMVGQASLILEGTSDWTGLTGKDSVQVSVSPRTPEGVREASGIDATHLLALIAGVGLVYFLTQRP